MDCLSIFRSFPNELKPLVRRFLVGPSPSAAVMRSAIEGLEERKAQLAAAIPGFRVESTGFSQQLSEIRKRADQDVPAYDTRTGTWVPQLYRNSDFRWGSDCTVYSFVNRPQ